MPPSECPATAMWPGSMRPLRALPCSALRLSSSLMTKLTSAGSLNRSACVGPPGRAWPLAREHRRRHHVSRERPGVQQTVIDRRPDVETVHEHDQRLLARGQARGARTCRRDRVAHVGHERARVLLTMGEPDHPAAVGEGEDLHADRGSALCAGGGGGRPRSGGPALATPWRMRLRAPHGGGSAAPRGPAAMTPPPRDQDGADAHAPRPAPGPGRRATGVGAPRETARRRRRRHRRRRGVSPPRPVDRRALHPPGASGSGRRGQVGPAGAHGDAAVPAKVADHHDAPRDPGERAVAAIAHAPSGAPHGGGAVLAAGW